MICIRKDFDRDVNDLFGFIAKHLPHDWKIELYVVNGEVGINLEDPKFEYAEVCTDDCDHIGHWVAFVNHARKVEGLELVEWSES